MFIRKTVSKSKTEAGKKYYTYRLVESVRVGEKVRQRTLLNLGADFDLDQELWSDLARRIDAIVHHKPILFEPGVEVEAYAQRYAAQLLAAQGMDDTEEAVEEKAQRYTTVDLNTLTLVKARSIGAEHLLFETIRSLKLDEKFLELGATRAQYHQALGVLIAKALHPASESASLTWLRTQSGAGELYGCDYEKISLSGFYRISDWLLAHKAALQSHLYAVQKERFGLSETITLYDLTNTYFEGSAAGVEQAARGRYKEKRSDAPLITLAVVLDGSGFIRHSEIFEGNVSEPQTLQSMIEKLESKARVLLPRPLVVMDAGIATEANIERLATLQYEYLVVSRKRHKEFDETKAVNVKTSDSGDVVVRAHKVRNAEGEVELYCRSEAKADKENAFEEALTYLKEGLTRPRRIKNYDRVIEKIGRLKEKYSSIARFYTINVTKAQQGAVDLTFERTAELDHKGAMNGVYCLRTNNQTLDETTLWNTYTMLTDLEALFRTLKSELGLRPIYHQKQSRVEGHLWITLLSYSIIHTVRYRLKTQGIHESWNTLRNVMKSPYYDILAV